MALQMHGHQRFLHDVFRIAFAPPRSRQPAPDDRPQGAREIAEQAIIGRGVSSLRRNYPLGPNKLALAQADS
jgi:hypothetical protein